MSCPSAVLAQGESGVGCTPLSPLSATHMTTESGSGASLGTESAMDVIVNKDLVEGSPLTETVDRQAFQIFPDLEEVALGAEGCAGDGYSRERLPSIMVEPTELDNMESRELCWPPEELAVLVDEDPFSEPCTVPTNPADSTRHEEQSGDEKGSPSKGGVQRRQSNSPTAAQLSCFRLTPPLHVTVQKRCLPACAAETQTGNLEESAHPRAHILTGKRLHEDFYQDHKICWACVAPTER